MVSFQVLAICTAACVLLIEAANFQNAIMLTKTLNDGTVMPIVGLGTWKSPKDQVYHAVRHALCKSGYRHIDAAQIYNNQEEVGRAIKHAIEECDVLREDLWVTSKIWNSDFENVTSATDRILKELGLDYVDQLLLHWPTPYKRPPAGCPPDCPEEFGGTDDPQRPRGKDGNLVLLDLTSYPLAKTWQELERVRAAGKVRSIGVSNFSPEEIDGLHKDGRTTIPAVNQVEAHVFWNQAALRKAMHERGITLVAYSPLGNPAIYADKVAGMNGTLVAEIANEVQMTPAQVMLNFLIVLGDIVVPKSVTDFRIYSNLNFQLKLTEEHIRRLSTEAEQTRLANPKNRQGGKHVFDIAEDTTLTPEIKMWEYLPQNEL